MVTFMESLLDENNDFDKLAKDSKAMEDLITTISVSIGDNVLLVFHQPFTP